MVLSTLADFIYNLCLFVCYVIKIATFIGALLFDTICNITWACRWLGEIIHTFLTVVNEDNRYFIQDVKSVVGGIAGFFTDNINSVCSAFENFISKEVAFVRSIPGIIFEKFKRSLVDIGEAVWCLVTLPLQLALLLLDFAVFSATWLKDVAKASFELGYDSMNTFIHYTIHDVPVEAAGGLGLLVLAYVYRKAIIPFLRKAAFGLFRLLRSLLLKCIRLVKSIYQAYTVRRAAFRAYCETQLPRRIDQIRNSLHERATDILDSEAWPMFHSIRSMFAMRNDDRNAVPIERPPVQAQRRHETPNRTTIGSCIICEDNDRSVAFVPCGHICACKICSNHLCNHNPVCPICRSYIRQKLEVFI
ncbi:hypothetical protein ZHAS_00003448 [Anopheles sinensis]|uniref:RING-type domain-containing protein n=1 Tax=Anopheles sinensis TaxID=74873 RepID=A0A084VED0_ANOSI|nr:hypothetical protein ZHAS_00003448 [Anopheles sinensis]